MDQILSYGVLILSWYALYVLVAGCAFGAYLAYRLWWREEFFKIKGDHRRPRQREVD
ncbi:MULTISPECIES: hypothetical protein [unclassified Herbaspirillum]|uniref:hypothetical protein n=1 Tax=unclassified Herbaspirillum TaxID=2624150 RepID=UPI0016203CD5|nr:MULTISPECIES: hypothetical protein [unclassified Herbaspirillum]MBB5393305.1 hypothetical protein [Herbaspirillum sp. SJZ102]